MSSRFIVAALAAASLASAAGIRLSGQTDDPRSEVEKLLAGVQFTPSEIANLQNGKVISRVDSGTDTGELVTQAAIKMRVPHEKAVSYYGQMIAYVDGKVTLGFGHFSTPAVAADAAKLAFDRSEVEEMKGCRPGSCDIRFGAAGLRTLQTAIDWKSSDYENRVNAYARQAAVDYVNEYRRKGDQALVTYNDRDEPMNLRDAWSGIVKSSSGFRGMLPELERYLVQYPSEPLPGGRDIIYWIKENYGLKPVISIVHGVIYAPPGRTNRTIVAQKYIYASHYYDASLAVASIISGTENGAPVTYILYGNRSRGDMLKGGFGGMKRTAARSQARKAAEGTLTTIKQVLEGQAAN
jgi:hypothetical protein